MLLCRIEHNSGTCLQYAPRSLCVGASVSTAEYCPGPGAISRYIACDRQQEEDTHQHELVSILMYKVGTGKIESTRRERAGPPRRTAPLGAFTAHSAHLRRRLSPCAIHSLYNSPNRATSRALLQTHSITLPLFKAPTQEHHGLIPSSSNH